MKSNKIAFLLLLLFLYSANLSAQNKPFFFIQITDPQFGMIENNKGFGKETTLYEKAVTEINRLKPDFVVVTGDLVNNQNDTSQILEFKRITETIDPKIPVYVTPGNHDIGNTPDDKSIATFIKNYGYDHFSFKHKNTLFIGINSSLIKNKVPILEQKQYDWLAKTLSKGKRAAHIVLFSHFPFFIKSSDEAEVYSNIGIESREKYLTLFAKNKVEAIFAGHLHNNAISKYGKIEMITTSSVGKPLGTVPSGFRIIKVYPDKIEHEYYGLEEIPDSIKLMQKNSKPII